MTCKEAKQFIMGYLYQEISTEQRKIIDAHLASCDSCRNEFAALKNTSTILQSWEEVEPKLNLVFMKETDSVWQQLALKLRSYFGSGEHWGRRVAYGLAIVLIILSIANLEISFADGNFRLKMSLWPKSEPVQVLNQPITENDLLTFKKDQLFLMNQLIETSETKQRRDMLLSFTDFAQELERQRKSDMVLVGTSLEQLQYQTRKKN